MSVANPRPQNTAASRPSAQIANATDILNGLQSENVEVITRTLASIRNLLYIKPETRVESDDKRLLLVQEWLQRDEEMYSVFEIWDKADKDRQTSVISLALAVISATLNLLSTHYTYHALGHAIVRSLISSSNAYSTRISNYLGGSSPADVILSTLKLWNSMSNFASGRERKTVLAIFPWEQKALSKLLNMRRRSDNKDHPLAKPDIRTLYILFLLSFVDLTSPSSLKTSFLQVHSQKLQAVFKGVAQDPYAVLRRTLEVCWAGIWEDKRIPRTSKVVLFTDITILQLVKLYERRTPEGNQEEVAADLVHHFLLAICTRPGTGVCFTDRGWYPKSNSEYLDDSESKEGFDREYSRTKIYNHILANVLKGLRPSADERQQELVLKMLQAAPELVPGFWPAVNLTLDPRLSSRWIDNIALVGHVVSLPVPLQTFRHAPENVSSSTGRQYHHVPPPLSAVMDSILPSTINTRTMFTKGLQSPSRLVQHCTSLALSKALEKYLTIRVAFSDISSALGELPTDQTGWRERMSDTEKEMRKRSPEFSVILAYTMASEASPMLMESAMRLLRLYSSALPSVVMETRFDLGKLLLKAFNPSSQSSWTSIIQLHVLRVLEANIGQFDWSCKTEKKSYLAFLLYSYLSRTTSAPVRHAIHRFIVVLLTDSPLFEDSIIAMEVGIWLDCLPRSERRLVKGSSLTNERQSVVDFLDDCIQRFLKTPHKYREQLETSDGQGSPLLMVVLEQLRAKIDRQLLSGSDILALATYMRMLLFRLSLSLERGFMESISKILELSLSLATFEEDDLGITRAIVMERKLIQSCIYTSTNIVNEDVDASMDILTLPDVLEIPPQEMSPEERILIAYELVDQLRVAGSTVSKSSVREMFLRVKQLHTAAAEIFLWHVSIESLWDIVDNVVDAVSYCSPEWLLFSTPPSLLVVDRIELGLSACVKARTGLSGTLQNFAVRLVRRLTGDNEGEDTVLLRLLALVADSLTTQSAKRGLAELDNFQSVSMQSTLSEAVLRALMRVVRIFLSPQNTEDSAAVQPISKHWFSVLAQWPESPFTGSTSTIALWIPFFTTPHLREALDVIAAQVHRNPEDVAAVDVLTALLAETNQRVDISVPLATLLALRRTVGGSLLNKALALSMKRCVPRGLLPITYGGQSLASELQDDIRTSIKVLHSTPLPDVEDFLTASGWSDDTIDIVQRTMAVCPGARASFSSWLASTKEDIWQNKSFARSHGRLLAMHLYTERTGFAMLKGALLALLPALFAAQATEALSSIYRVAPQEDKDVLAAFVVQAQDATFSSELLQLGIEIGAGDILTIIVDKGMHWAVNKLGEKQVDTIMMGKLMLAIDGCQTVKPHLAEPLITVAIQNHLAEPSVIKLLTSLVQKSKMKHEIQPVSINRYLLLLGQHSGLTKFPRKSLVQLLYHLFLTHPSNTCQLAHVEPLIALYQGTMLMEDRMLLQIFQMFERERRLSAGSIFGAWSGKEGTSGGVVDAVLTLDNSSVLHTCLHFPDDYKIADGNLLEGTESLIDPVFAILLTSQALAAGLGNSTVEFFRTGVVGLAIRALSAIEENVRMLALEVLSKLWRMFEEGSIIMQESAEVMHVLSILRNSIQPTSEVPQLPCYISLLITHALRSIMFPSTPIYPIISRFLLQRNILDTTDVPMLLAMLYSSSKTSKLEKAWMLAFLDNGLQTENDLAAFGRRHTWDLLCGMFESMSDKFMQVKILKIFQTALKNQKTSLILIHQYGLLSWIEAQLLQNSKDIAAHIWLDMFASMAAVLSVSPHVTLASWSALVRCVSLSMKCLPFSIIHLQLAASILTWIPRTINLSSILKDFLLHLEVLEDTAELSILPGNVYLQEWERAVQKIWKVGMQQETLSANTFSCLTQRLLLLHDLGVYGKTIAWVAKEATFML